MNKLSKVVYVQLVAGACFLATLIALDSVTGRPVFKPGAWLIETGVVVWVLVMSTLIHEAGHVIAGWLVGFRLVALTLGPLRIEETMYGRHITWQGSRLREAGAARVGLAPVKFGRMRMRALVAVLGGPAASINGGLAALAGFVMVLGTADSWVAPFAVGAFGGLSLIVGATNGLVMQTGGFQSDGWFARALVLDDAEGAAHQALLILRGHQALLRTRPREWPPAEVGLLAESQSAGERAMGLVAQAELAEDSGQNGAWQPLREAAELEEAHAWPHALAIAYGAAVYGKRGDVAEEWFRVAVEQNPPKAALLIPAAAVLVAQGEDAADRLRQAITHFKKDGSGYAEFMVERARRLLAG